MMPQPEIFEIKQVLKIPQSKIEQRHDLMISMICDRIKNRDKYERMHFFWSYPLQKELGFYEPKYYPKKNSVELYEFWSNDGWLSHERTILRKRMKGCKHKEENILAILNADRWKPVPGNWPHMYIGDKLAVID